MTKTKAEIAVSQLTEFVNSATSKDIEEFSKVMMGEHRTLQEDTFMLFMETCKQWAKLDKDGNYDARNQFTVKTCKNIVPLI